MLDATPPTIAIGPEGLPSVAQLIIRNNPPISITGQKVKKRYEDELIMCIEMMETYSNREKMKVELQNTGFKT